MNNISHKTFKLILLISLGILGFIISQFSNFNLAYLMPSKEGQGSIIKVYDGDTLTILHNGDRKSVV